MDHEPLMWLLHGAFTAIPALNSSFDSKFNLAKLGWFYVRLDSFNLELIALIGYLNHAVTVPIGKNPNPQRPGLWKI